MPVHTTEAIVIRSLNYGESDKIVTFFTRDYGKLKGIAKGARRSKKRFQNALDSFSHLRLLFFDKEGMGLARVNSCDILNSFPRIRDHLEKILYGDYYLELVHELAGEREPHQEAFQVLVWSLGDLEREMPEEKCLRVFESRMLSLFGYQPNLKRCDLCKRGWKDLRQTGSLFFSCEKGSLVCDTCAKASNDLIPISLGTARLIEKISEMEWTKVHRLRFTPLALSESGELLPRFITYQLGKELKSLKVLKEVLSREHGSGELARR